MSESPPGWRHIGDESAGLVVAVADPRFAEALDDAIALAESGDDRVVIVGGVGTGKTTLALTAASFCDLNARPVLFLNKEQQLKTAFKSLTDEPGCLLIVEIDDDMTQSVRDAFLRAAEKASACLVTARQLSVAESHRLMGYRTHRLTFADTPREQVLAVGDLVWVHRLGMKDPVTTSAPGELARLLSGEPNTQGFCDVVMFVQALHERLVSRGAIEEGFLNRPIDEDDLNAALIAVWRSSQGRAGAAVQKRLVVVVEGTTDVTYLQHAAYLFNERWGAALLQGCDICAAGGARKLVRRLVIENEQNDAIGLFDCDEQGKASKKLADSLALKAALLPAEFDRQGHQPAVVEIEDLLPIELVKDFYARHPDLRPEWKAVGSNDEVTRIVVKGEDKELVADYFVEHGGYEDAEKLAYVVCRLWYLLGLPMPPGPAGALDEWFRELAASQGEPAA